MRRVVFRNEWHVNLEQDRRAGACPPGDIVLVDRNCHKSHHYGLVLCGGQPLYVEAYPLTEYSMYGAVPLRTIKKALLDLKAEGKLDRVRMLLLTNCTFDGHIYNVQRSWKRCSQSNQTSSFYGTRMDPYSTLLPIPSHALSYGSLRDVTRALRQRSLPS